MDLKEINASFPFVMINQHYSRPFTFRKIDFDMSTVLKLTSRPNFLFANLRYVSTILWWTSLRSSMDFSSTITRFSTKRSNSKANVKFFSFVNYRNISLTPHVKAGTS